MVYLSYATMGVTMKRTVAILLVLACLPALAWMAEPSEPADSEKNWPAWRGPHMTGVATSGNPPIEWSETKNVKWKVEIPGKGSSSPIVWGDKIFISTAVPTEQRAAPKKKEAAPGGGRQIDMSRLPERIRRRMEGMSAEERQRFMQRMRRRGPRGIQPEFVHQFVLYAINRADGKVLWKRVVQKELPHEGTHPTGTWASNSPVTDGEHVYAYFGSRGLYCFDMDGNLKWKKDFGDMRKRLTFGEGASPALHGDRIIVNWDHEGESFIVALDKKTGKELWRTERDESTSWATPVVVEHKGRKQIVTNATGKVRSYDFETGKLIWEAKGMTMNVIPTPVFSKGMVYVTSGFRGNALLAINLDKAKGDITETDAVVWSFDRDTPYAPSPLLYGDTLYFLKRNNGILSAFNARTGEPIFGPQRLEGVPNIYASPVGVAGRVYITGREGGVLVLKHGPAFEVLAMNQLDDGFDASPAIVGNEIYLRGRKYLYRISED